MKEEIPDRNSEGAPLTRIHVVAQSDEHHGLRDIGARKGMGTRAKNFASARCCPVCRQVEGTEWLWGRDRFHRRTEHYTLVRCPLCSFVWLDNPPAPDTMLEHYGTDYDNFIGAAGDSSPRRWWQRRDTLVQYKASGSLLDVGCSSGSFLETLEGDSWELYGIEMSVTPALKAQARSGARVFVGDVLDAPFAPNTFDAVTCFDVLEHLFNPREVLSRISEWLKPDGIFYLLVPNIESGEARVFRSYWYGLELPRHLSHFSPASLRYLAKSVGMEEVSVTTHPNSALGYSTRYVFDDFFQRLGMSRAPLATTTIPSFPWRVFRKLCRMTISPFLNRMISLAGPGESIHAVFKKTATV